VRAIDNRPYFVLCFLTYLPANIIAGRNINILFAAVGAIINRQPAAAENCKSDG
jgi:hypothetical protein